MHCEPLRWYYGSTAWELKKHGKVFSSDVLESSSTRFFKVFLDYVTIGYECEKLITSVAEHELFLQTKRGSPSIALHNYVNLMLTRWKHSLSKRLQPQG